MTVSDDEPACSAPLLNPLDNVAPCCMSADRPNGDPLGNVCAFGISVAVCVKLSVFMNRICEPTATVVIGGA